VLYTADQTAAQVAAACGITSVAWSPDGRSFATATQVLLTVYDAATGKARFACPGHAPVCWSPDGRYLASPSHARPRALTIWEADTGQEARSLRGHTADLRAVVWSPDGTRLASSDQATIKIWDAAAEPEASVLRGFDGPALDVAWSPDGTRLVAGGADRELRRRHGQGEPKPASSQALKVWETATGREVPAPDPATATVQSVAWSQDGRRLAHTIALTNGKGGETGHRSVRIWGLDEGRVLFTLRGDPPLLVASTRLAWSPGTDVATPSPSSSSVIASTHVAWSPRGARLATTSWDGYTTVWDATAGAALQTFQSGRRLAWSPDGTRLAGVWAGRIRRGSGMIIIWDVSRGQPLLPIRGHPQGNGDVAWSPDGTRLASGGSDGVIRIWDVASGRALLDLRGHAGPARRLAWSPNGHRLASGGEDGTIRIWDSTSGRETLTLHGCPAGVLVNAVAWSPDGRKRASAGSEGLIKIWDASTRDTGTGADAAAPSPAAASALDRWDEARSFSQFGALLAWNGWPMQGEDALRQALSGLESLSAAYPDRGNLRGELADTYGVLGDLLLTRGRPEEGLAFHRKVRTIRRRLARTFSQPEYQTAMLTSESRLVALLYQAHHRDEAEQAYRETLAEYRRALSRAPSALEAVKLASNLLPLARFLVEEGRPGDANAAYRLILEPVRQLIGNRLAVAPDLLRSMNDIAWFLATCPDPGYRDPDAAVALAREATRREPKAAAYWNTLGVAQYRAGDWKGAIEALEKAVALNGGGDAADGFFLAMAHWQMDTKDQARTWYDKAVTCMETNRPKDEELRRFRSEADALLGIRHPPAPEGAAKPAREE
jgi:WD40 repeat protein/tetratricopeptide (TPR) repeat protein